MADDSKRVVRTPGMYGTFHVGDVTITPDGTEIDYEQWKTIAAAAVTNRVVVRLDEDFPAELYAADAQKRIDESGESKPAGGSDPTPIVGGTEQSTTGGRRSGARNGD